MTWQLHLPFMDLFPLTCGRLPFLIVSACVRAGLQSSVGFWLYCGNWPVIIFPPNPSPPCKKINKKMTGRERRTLRWHPAAENMNAFVDSAEAPPCLLHKDLNGKEMKTCVLFSFWMLNCDTFPVKRKTRGNYSFSKIKKKGKLFLQGLVYRNTKINTFSMNP